MNANSVGAELAYVATALLVYGGATVQRRGVYVCAGPLLETWLWAWGVIGTAYWANRR